MHHATEKYPTPEVSVSLLVYNQRDVVGRAIESILAQETTFPFEIVIGDDCSDDGTQEVLRAYQARYPDIIQLILHPRRYRGEVAGRTNNMTNLAACRGRYTALLDGDDYWLGTDKLQSQYDILEQHPEVVLAYHDTEVRYLDAHDNVIRTTRSSAFRPGGALPTGVYTTSAYYGERYVGAHKSGACFRTRCFEYFPDNFTEVVGGDHYLFLLIAEQGKIYYEHKVRSVYFKHSRGFTGNATFTNIESQRRRLSDLTFYRSRFAFTRDTDSYRKAYAAMAFRIAKAAWSKRGSRALAVRMVFDSLTTDPKVIFGRLMGALSLAKK